MKAAGSGVSASAKSERAADHHLVARHGHFAADNREDADDNHGDLNAENHRLLRIPLAGNQPRAVGARRRVGEGV